MRKPTAFLILLLAASLMASELERDVVMFGSIFSTAINASGKIPYRVSPFVVEDYGVFYFIHSPKMRGLRERMARKFRKLPPQKRKEAVAKLQEKRGEIVQRIREGIKKAIVAASRYGEVLKNVPDSYWLAFVFQSPRSIGSVSFPCMVVKVRMKDVRAFSRGKLSEEEFSRRIILPSIPEQTPPVKK